jgi:hypothetical protein
MGQTGNALAQASINATYLFTSNSSLTCGGCGWAEQLHPRARSRLTLLLDAGWMESASGTACPAFSKFPPSGPSETCAARLASISAAVTSVGWRSLGLWFGDISGNATAQLLTVAAGGVDYLKIDGGDRDNVLTPLGRMVARNIVVEHAFGAGPLNTGPGGSFEPHIAKAWWAMANNTDTFRTYDVTQQLAIPTTLARVASILPFLDAQPRALPDPRAIVNAEDECILSVVLLGTCGVMRYSYTGLRQPDWDLFFPNPVPTLVTRRIKAKMDEIARALAWQDDAPPYGAGALSVFASGIRGTLVDDVTLADNYTFVPGSHWDASILNTTQVQVAPARVARGLGALPSVVPSGLPPLELANASDGPRLASSPPFVVSSRHANGAVGVATLGRMDADALWYYPLAHVTLPPIAAAAAGPFGIFGHFASLTLSFTAPGIAPGTRFIANDLLAAPAGSAGTDISSSVAVSPDGLTATIDGKIIDAIGLSLATPGDSSDPGLKLVLTR